MRTRLVTALVAVGIASSAVASVTPASASTGATNVSQASVSSNWAGYVSTGGDSTTGTPTSFTSVSGTWVEPKANCNAVSATGPTASAFWVGLGGSSTGSTALEQTGTEADCSSTGTARYFAWYELVPAASVKLGLAVTPGDKISAAVSVDGTSVTLEMKNLTRGTSVSKTLTMAAPDTSSAEWIAEAPSECASSSYCTETTLTNFGSVKFTNASAQSAGQTGSISDSSWSAAPIELEGASGAGAFGRFGGEQSISEALPSALAQSGSTFSVAWHELTQSQPQGGYGYGSGNGLAY